MHLVFEMALAEQNSSVLEEGDGLFGDLFVTGHSLPLCAKPRQA
jgi:hypothetical protein